MENSCSTVCAELCILKSVFFKIDLINLFRIRKDILILLDQKDSFFFFPTGMGHNFFFLCMPLNFFAEN